MFSGPALVRGMVLSCFCFITTVLTLLSSTVHAIAAPPPNTNASKLPLVKRYLLAIKENEKVKTNIQALRANLDNDFLRLSEERFRPVHNLAIAEKESKIRTARKFLADRTWQILFEGGISPEQVLNSLAEKEVENSFSTADLEYICNFYESELGKKSLSLDAPVAAATENLIRDKLFPELNNIAEEWIKEIVHGGSP